MSYIDLHMHSIYSNDGEFDPRKLVDLCLDKKIRYFSITDHNSVNAIDEAIVYCKDKDIDIIPGVELDCTFDGIDLHVLGYGIDHHNPIFKDIEENVMLQEQKASKKRIELIRNSGIDFSDEMIAALARNGIVTGEMIAEAALKFDKERSNSLLQPYRENGHRSDNPYVNFYWDYFSQGKPAYTAVRYISLTEALKVIEENGGIPVLAHPGNNIREDMAKLEAIVASGIKGIEVYSSYHSKTQASLYKGFALEHGLIITCGSDFHGKTKPGISIGCSDCENNEESIILELK